MPIVTDTPEWRFEYKYNDITTVLEGKELVILMELVMKYDRTLRKGEKDLEVVFLLSIVNAFQDMYGKDSVYQEELRDLSTADARKMDLLFKGMYIIRYRAINQDEDWKKIGMGDNNESKIVNELDNLYRGNKTGNASLSGNKQYNSYKNIKPDYLIRLIEARGLKLNKPNDGLRKST